MANTKRCDELKGLEEAIQTLTAQGDDCRRLFNSTAEFKRLLSEKCDEDVLTERLKERGVLLDRLASFKECCDSVTGYLSSITDGKQKEGLIDIFRQIKQQLEATRLLDVDIASMLDLCIREINVNLRKIQEGRSLMHTLRDPDGGLSVNLDVSG
jgi:hypothetical protein